MDVKDIIIEKLKALGADGLGCDECGCGLEDIAPCSCDSVLSCEPAIKKLAVTAEEKAEFDDYYFVVAEIENGRVKRPN